jgi:hypothetical protein
VWSRKERRKTKRRNVAQPPSAVSYDSPQTKAAGLHVRLSFVCFAQVRADDLAQQGYGTLVKNGSTGDETREYHDRFR